jgi:hypothetical protein
MVSIKILRQTLLYSVIEYHLCVTSDLTGHSRYCPWSASILMDPLLIVCVQAWFEMVNLCIIGLLAHTLLAHSTNQKCLATNGPSKEDLFNISSLISWIISMYAFYISSWVKGFSCLLCGSCLYNYLWFASGSQAVPKWLCGGRC